MTPPRKAKSPLTQIKSIVKTIGNAGKKAISRANKKSSLRKSASTGSITDMLNPAKPAAVTSSPIAIDSPTHPAGPSVSIKVRRSRRLQGEEAAIPITSVHIPDATSPAEVTIENITTPSPARPTRKVKGQGKKTKDDKKDGKKPRNRNLKSLLTPYAVAYVCSGSTPL